jgi:hypothetical protein
MIERIPCAPSVREGMSGREVQALPIDGLGSMQLGRVKRGGGAYRNRWPRPRMNPTRTSWILG